MSIPLAYTVITIICLVSGRITCTRSIPLAYTVIKLCLVSGRIMYTRSIPLVYTLISIICLVSGKIMCTRSIPLVYTFITIICLVSGRIMCTRSIYTVEYPLFIQSDTMLLFCFILSSQSFSISLPLPQAFLASIVVGGATRIV